MGKTSLEPLVLLSTLLSGLLAPILGAWAPPGGQSGPCSSASVLVPPGTGGPL